MVGATAAGWNRQVGSRLYISPLVVASILLFGGVECAWSQENIGGAKTVVNHVEGNLATGNQVPVVQGDNVFLNEVVRSGPDSKANLVLNDNSNVTVGPGSTIKLDDFVYSGPKQGGTIALNMTKGTLRFITGDANKRAYTIYTPTAAIGVRGTILRIQATPTETKVINEEGIAIVCHRNKNEYASVEELRKRRCSKEQREKGLCGCQELLVPNQEATISQSEIAVTEAPVNAISDPIIAEGFALGGAPLVGAGVIGAGIIAAGVAVGVSSTSSSSAPPFIPPPLSP
jgi:FecR protein